MCGNIAPAPKNFVLKSCQPLAAHHTPMSYRKAFAHAIRCHHAICFSGASRWRGNSRHKLWRHVLGTPRRYPRACGFVPEWGRCSMQKMLSIIANVLRGSASKNVRCFYFCMVLLLDYTIAPDLVLYTDIICWQFVKMLNVLTPAMVELTLPASKLGNALGSATLGGT